MAAIWNNALVRYAGSDSCFHVGTGGGRNRMAWLCPSTDVKEIWPCHVRCSVGYHLGSVAPTLILSGSSGHLSPVIPAVFVTGNGTFSYHGMAFLESKRKFIAPHG